MRWTPWQEAQFATWVSPALDLRPWYESMKVVRRPVLMPYFSLSTADSWHGEQVISATLERDTGDNGSSGDRIPCSPWQSVQTGASVSPRATSWPWMPSQKSTRHPCGTDRRSWGC